MNNIYNEQTIDNFIERIKLLDKGQNPLWGKMTAPQMVRHCVLNDEMLQGKKRYKRLIMGRLFGPMVLKKILRENIMAVNQPTHPALKIKGKVDFELEKKNWIALLEDYGHFNVKEFTHPFFGKMSHDEIGHFAYKHIDHHLRQFNV